MVLVVELLLGVGVLVGVYRVATGDGHLAPPFEPDGPAGVRDDRLLSADDVAAYRLAWGLGYRKADVDRLLDRLARQLPRAGEEPPATPATPGEPVSLGKWQVQGPTGGDGHG